MGGEVWGWCGGRFGKRDGEGARDGDGVFVIVLQYHPAQGVAACVTPIRFASCGVVWQGRLLGREEGREGGSDGRREARE